jgi:hypothetical protein
MRTLPVVALAILLSSCDSKPSALAPTPAPKVVSTPKPADESRRFPKANRISTIVVDKELLGKAFMPGGTLGQYRKGKTEYDVFVARAATSTDAALILPDWEHALGDSKFIPSFGGYFGHDAGRPVFVFTKGPWIAGIAGLPEREADRIARELAKALE